MAAIVDTAVTNVSLTKNTPAEITYTAATNTGTLVTDTETFKITPTKRDGEQVIFVKNDSGATVKVAALAGDFWFNATDMTAVDVATAKVFALTIDTAKYMKKDGTIHIKITPTAGTALTASNKVNITAVEL